MFNQDEVDSIDQYLWRHERDVLHQRVSNLCANHNIGFCQNSLFRYLQNNKHTKIVFMWLFDLIGDHAHWTQVNELCQKLGKKVFVVTDNIVDFDPLPNIHFFYYYQFLGMTASYQDAVHAPTEPSKLYNCFIQRVCSVRQSWFYFLYHYELLDSGYVSLLMKQLASYSTKTGVDLFDYIHYHYKLNELPHFDRAYHEMRHQVPYRNFEETGNLLPLIQDSKYSLVLETYSTEDDVGRFCVGEKALRALQFPNVCLLFLQKNFLSRLEQLGLKFDVKISKLDNLPWQQRQLALLDILVQDSVDFDADNLYNQCQHNRALLQGWKAEYQRSDFFDTLFYKVVSD